MRWVWWVAGTVVLVGAVCLPAAFWNLSLGEDAFEPTSITSYDADFRVEDDGDLVVHESITVLFPGSDRHGIFRFFDRADAPDPRQRVEPDDITVRMDGGEVPVDVYTEEHGRITVAKIGDPDETVASGQHTYDIGYRVEGVLTEGGADAEAPTQLYWDLVPGGWQQSIDRARLTVHLPASAEGLRCAVGSGSVGGCQVDGEGTDTLTVRAESLPAHTPVTLLAGIDVPTPPPGESRPWTARWDRVLGPGPVLLVVVLLLAVAAFGAGLLVARRVRERRPGFPLTYAPPAGMGPAQVQYLLTERLDHASYVATLMHAAELGAVELRREGDTWSVIDGGGEEAWARTDPVTREIAHVLGGPGTTFTAARGDVEAGKRLKTEIDRFHGVVRRWARDAGLVTDAGLGALNLTTVLAAVVVTVLLLTWNPQSMTAVALIPGLFAVGAVELAMPGSATRRTATGRRAWAECGGFRRVLATPSSEARFDFSGRQELFTAFVPYAVALGCADAWAEKYRVETASEPPTPAYWGYGYGAYAAGTWDTSMVDDFSSTVDAAISSYNATQSSSSSGGGFSGGGGGGGGGGGSW